MPGALTLEQAAGQAYENLNIRWLADTLKTHLTNFWRIVIAIFPDQGEGGRPIANWMTIIAALADQMPATDVPLDQLTDAATDVYKACWLASYLESIGQITSAQATAMLAAYNSQL